MDLWGRFRRATEAERAALAREAKSLAADMDAYTKALERALAAVPRGTASPAMPNVVLIIIDEEHDGSYKQQDGFRYNARDLAIVRASKRNIPVILGSATPSLESLNNVRQQRYIGHHLRQRANNRPLPSLHLINLCSQKMFEGIADSMLNRIKQHLDADG